MKYTNILIQTCFAGIALFFIVGFFWWTVVPYYHMTIWRTSINAFIQGDDLKFPNDPKIYAHDNSVQMRMRLDAFSYLFNQYVHGVRTGYTPLYDVAFSRVREFVDAHPYRIDEMLFVAKGYEFEADLTHNASLYDLADQYFKKALALSPDRQDTLYAYAEHLSNTGKKQEAIELLESMLKKDPEIVQTGYYMGVVLAANDKVDYDRSLDYLEKAFNLGLVSGDKIVLKNIYEHFFVYYYDRNDTERFNMAIKRLLILDPSQNKSYQSISDYLDANHSIPPINIHS